MPIISKRLSYFDSSDFREVFNRLQTIQDPIDLSVGIPEDPTPEHIKRAGIKAIEENKTTYTPANGIRELRAAIAKKLIEDNGIHVSEDQVTIVPGLTTGQLLLYLAILDPGDEIIVMDPYYPPYKYLATAVGATVMDVPTLPTFHPDIPLIKASITDRTKAIMINSPNNPTGAVYSKEELVELAKIAAEHNLLIVSDEIYEHFIHDGEHFSIGSIYTNTVTMNGFSKEYAMTGWRLGYIAGPPEVIDAINELQQYVIFSSSSIAQYAALEALKHPSDLPEKYKHKRDLVYRRLKKLGYEIHGAQGGYYFFLQAPSSLTDIEFIERAAERSLVLVPGRAFSTRHGYFRLSYGGDEKTLIRGLDIIEEITMGLKETGP